MNNIDLLRLIGGSLPLPLARASLRRSRLAGTALAPEETEQLLRVAREHEVLPALSAVLSSGVRLPDGELLPELETIHRLNARRNEHMLEEAEDVITRLNSAGIEPVLLKGIAHLARGLYPRPGCRFVSDIDLLVEEQEIGTARVVLAECGYTQVLPQLRDDPQGKHFPRLTSDRGIGAVELHRALGDIPWRDILPPDEVRHGSVSIGLGSARCRVPSAADAVIHTVIHSQLDDEGHWRPPATLRRVYDFVLLASRPSVDWERVRERFAVHGLEDVLRGLCSWAVFLFPIPAFTFPGFSGRPPRRFVAGAENNLAYRCLRPAIWSNWYVRRALRSREFRMQIRLKISSRDHRRLLATRSLRWVSGILGRLGGRRA